MLKEWKAPEQPSEEEVKARLAAAREKLAGQQLLIKEKKLPVFVLVEGWGTAGKGYCIGQIIKNIDPRFSRWNLWGRRRRKMAENHSCTVTLSESRRKVNLSS